MFDAHDVASSCLDSTVAVCPPYPPSDACEEVDHYWPHVTMFGQGVMRFGNHIKRMLLLIQCVIKLNLSSVWSAYFKLTLCGFNTKTRFWLLSTLLGVLLSRPPLSFGHYILGGLLIKVSDTLLSATVVAPTDLHVTKYIENTFIIMILGGHDYLWQKGELLFSVFWL